MAVLTVVAGGAEGGEALAGLALGVVALVAGFVLAAVEAFGTLLHAFAVVQVQMLLSQITRGYTVLLLKLLIYKPLVLDALARAKVAKRHVIPSALVPLLNGTIIRTPIKRDRVIIIAFLIPHHNSIPTYAPTNIRGVRCISGAVPPSLFFTVLITAILILCVAVIALFSIRSDPIPAFGCADVDFIG